MHNCYFSASQWNSARLLLLPVGECRGDAGALFGEGVNPHPNPLPQEEGTDCARVFSLSPGESVEGMPTLYLAKVSTLILTLSLRKREPTVRVFSPSPRGRGPG